jgi:hypothetical protein
MRVLTLIACAAAILALPATAAAGPNGGPTFRDRDQFTDVDTNFCDTGATVLIDGTAVANGWIGETGGDPDQLLKLTLNLHITYTNPLNGNAVVERWSTVQRNEIIAGTEAGAHTHEFTETGLKATLRLANGGVLTRDAGSLTYRVSFDAADNVVGVDVGPVHGPHPGFFEDLFCPTVIEALDL